MRCGQFFFVSKVLAFLFLTFSNASAGGLSIWPLQVNLQDNGAVRELNVTNPTDEATFVQVSTVEWHDPGEAGQAHHVEGVLAVPPIFELPPKSRQLVRIASRKPIDDGIERAYRLVITEVPRTAGLVPNSLSIATRMTLPVFVTPDGAEPDPIWSIDPGNNDSLQLILSNQGNASIKVRKVELISSDKENPAFSTDEGSLVLAGKAASWSLDLDPTQIQGPLTVRAETTAGLIEGFISLTGG